MATVNNCVTVDGECPVNVLKEAGELIDAEQREILLDFTAVRYIDPAALCALQELADNAGAKAVTLELRGVSVVVYKVLKLARLESHFVFSIDDGHPTANEQESSHAESSARRSSILG